MFHCVESRREGPEQRERRLEPTHLPCPSPPHIRGPGLPELLILLGTALQSHTFVQLSTWNAFPSLISLLIPAVL